MTLTHWMAHTQSLAGCCWRGLLQVESSYRCCSWPAVIAAQSLWKPRRMECRKEIAALSWENSGQIHYRNVVLTFFGRLTADMKNSSSSVWWAINQLWLPRYFIISTLWPVFRHWQDNRWRYSFPSPAFLSAKVSLQACMRSQASVCREWVRKKTVTIRQLMTFALLSVYRLQYRCRREIFHSSRYKRQSTADVSPSSAAVFRT